MLDAGAGREADRKARPRYTVAELVVLAAVAPELLAHQPDPIKDVLAPEGTVHDDDHVVGNVLKVDFRTERPQMARVPKTEVVAVGDPGLRKSNISTDELILPVAMGVEVPSHELRCGNSVIVEKDDQPGAGFPHPGVAFRGECVDVEVDIAQVRVFRHQTSHHFCGAVATARVADDHLVVLAGDGLILGRPDHALKQSPSAVSGDSEGNFRQVTHRSAPALILVLADQNPRPRTVPYKTSWAE